MRGDKYHWDGDTPDERDSELRSGRHSLSHDGGHTPASLARQASTQPRGNPWRMVWLGLAACALVVAIVYLFRHHRLG